MDPHMCQIPLFMRLQGNSAPANPSSASARSAETPPIPAGVRGIGGIPHRIGGPHRVAQSERASGA